MATVVFSDLSGYTAMNEALDPEDVIEAMERIRSEAARIAEQHGGLLNQVVGDEVVMLFGVPTAHDDDPLRAVNAALALHESVGDVSEELGTDLGRPLRMHTGVHTGLVLVTSGDERGGIYAITGDTVNTCARIRSAAEAGEVMVGPTTLEVVAPFFQTRATAPLPLKGKALPLVAHCIVGRTDHRERFDVARSRGLQRQVGRDDEVSMLDQDLRSACGGALRSVALVGEAGVGKSRLLHELLGSVAAANATLCQGRCESYGEVAPYQPFVGVLREVFELEGEAGARDAVERVVGRVNQRWPELIPQIPYYLRLLALDSDEHAVPREVSGVSLQEMLLDSLCALFKALSHERTLVLTLEDWHWADAASDLAMQRVLRALDGPAMVVLSMRPERRPSWLEQLSRTVRLQALDGSLTGELARAVLGADSLSESLARFLYERTAGNPLFVEEFCRALVEEKLIEIDDASARLTTGTQADALPFTVQSVVRSRVDRLPEAERAVLSLAAVIGSHVPVHFLEALYEEPEDAEEHEKLGACLRGLENAQLLRRGDRPGSYVFSHAVIREVTYEAILKKSRRLLHDRVAELIEATFEGDRLASEYESLAHHYGAAGKADQAARFGELAGDKAAAAHSLEQAAAQYRKAVAHLQTLSGREALTRRRIELSLKWGQVAIWKPDPMQRAVLESALFDCESLGDLRGAALAVYWMGWHLYTLGEHARATERFSDCIARGAEAGLDRLVAQAHANLAYCHAANRKLDEALACLERARLPGPSGRRLWGDMLMDGYRGMVLGDRGDFDQAYVHLEAARESSRRHRNPPAEGSALTQLGMVQCQQGAFAAARATGDALLDMAQRIQAPYLHAMGLTVHGQVQTYLDGDPQGALTHLDEAVEQLEELGIQITMSWNRACQAEALVLAGHQVRAERSAHRALARREAGDRRGEIMALRVLALASAMGPDADADAALAGLDAARSRAEQDALPRERILCDFWRAELLARLGRHEASRQAARAVLPALAAMGMGYYLAHAGRLAA